MSFQKRYRSVIQSFFLGVSLFLLALLYFDVIKVVHQYCPYSVICFGTLSIKQGLIYYPISFIIFGLITLSALFIGRWFCGYICFIGTIQEWLYRKLHPKCHQIVKLNYSEERNIGFFKYIVLAITIILGFFGLSRIYMGYCPVMSLGWLKTITLSGVIILGVILIGGVFIERFWCRFICPYAALLNIFCIIGKKLKLPQYKINRNLETCIDCYICCKVCPMNINLLENELIDHENCIKCMRCLDRCPKKGTLTNRW